MARPTLESLRLDTSVGKETIFFKEAQEGMPPGGMQPEVGQSPVVGNPDEMQAPESANQKQFEDDFGSLAYQFVQDRAPAFIPYMLGFEVVDRNEDGSRAVGIFGYKVDEDFYYVPAFFLNNQVRGVDMILSKRTNQFIPLTEEWIDFIINKHSVSIGGPADERVRDTMRNPDLTFVRRPQLALGKVAETHETPWTFAQAWGQIKEATAKVMSDPGFREMFEGAVSRKAVKAAEAKYIKDFMERDGGPECMASFLGAMHDVGFANAAMTLYKGAEAFLTDNLSKARIHVERMRKKAEAMPKVRIVDSVHGLAKAASDAPASDVGENKDVPLSMEENARQIIEHDFTIEDSRPDKDVSEVVEGDVLVEFEHKFQPPSGPGKYNFVMQDGMAREGIMLNAVVSPECRRENTLFCFEDDGFILAEALPRALVTTEFKEDSETGNPESDPLKELYDRAIPLSDVEVEPEFGKTYLFIDDKGNAAGPFALKFAMSDNGRDRFVTGYSSDTIITTPAPGGLDVEYGFMDWDLSDRFHDSDGCRNGKPSFECCCEPCDERLIEIGSFKGMPKKTGAGLIIPQGWKALELRRTRGWFPPPVEDLSDEERRKRNAKVEEDRAKMKSRYTFGSMMDVLCSMVDEGAEYVKVASDGVEYSMKVAGASKAHGPMGYKAAAVDLVTRFGLRPRRAFDVLSKAAAGDTVRMLVSIPSLRKSAQDNLVGVSMPAPMEQLPSIDPYSGVPVYASPYIEAVQGQYTGVPGLPPEGGMTRGINIGGEMERNMGGQEVQDEHDSLSRNGALPIDEEARRLAEEAAAAGQRHVFDQAAIGGLAKVYDTAGVVDSYIPDFMDTIDRLGRILFLFYWKHEDFNQRYGSDDVVQMEDSLRNVFKNLGELTLHLKEKSVQKE